MRRMKRSERDAREGHPESAAVRYDGRYLGLHERVGWEYATRTNATGVVVIVPLTVAEEVVFVEQYRVPVRNRVIELPAGLVGDEGDPDERLATAAERELWEETGYRAGRLTCLGQCPSSAGMTDETLTLFLAEHCRQEGPGGGDASEDITVHPVALNQVDRWLAEQQRAGLDFDPKIYAALYWIERRSSLGDLFPSLGTVDA
jgi:ADP-ribose pyrophosphatase